MCRDPSPYQTPFGVLSLSVRQCESIITSIKLRSLETPETRLRMNLTCHTLTSVQYKGKAWEFMGTHLEICLQKTVFNVQALLQCICLDYRDSSRQLGRGRCNWMHRVRRMEKWIPFVRRIVEVDWILWGWGHVGIIPYRVELEITTIQTGTRAVQKQQEKKDTQGQPWAHRQL